LSAIVLNLVFVIPLMFFGTGWISALTIGPATWLIVTLLGGDLGPCYQSELRIGGFVGLAVAFFAWANIHYFLHFFEIPRPEKLRAGTTLWAVVLPVGFVLSLIVTLMESFPRCPGG
jgi:hypothetical protein